ncbi:MAG: hypothetical protein ACK5VW_06570 [Holosporales bacterium]
MARLRGRAVSFAPSFCACLFILTLAMAAGVGAAGAEAIAEGLAGDPREFLQKKIQAVVAADGSISQEGFARAWDEHIQEASNIARFAVACGTLMAKQDVAAAVGAADNALEHNILPFLGVAVL